jgi:hypothetical protein
MRIEIKTIPHDQHRYESVGDWEIKPNGKIKIEVSEMGNDDYALLVGIHELIESWLCRKRKIPEDLVNAFDIAYESKRSEGDVSEPGDAPDAPYRREHQFATKIERQLAEELGVKWDEYDEAINSL